MTFFEFWAGKQMMQAKKPAAYPNALRDRDLSLHHTHHRIFSSPVRQMHFCRVI